MNKMTFWSRFAAKMVRMADNENGGGAADANIQADAGADTQAGGGADTQAGGSAGAKWWEGAPENQRQFLTAKGLTLDDPTQVLPKVIDIAANLEKRIGRGMETIIDRPAKDEAFGDWARKNAAALGLPEKEDGYTVQKPDFWPKDAPWDEKLEGAARSLAFKHGLPPAAFQEFVNLQAQTMKGLMDGADTALATARENMMTELNRDWGTQTGARITQAKQGLQYVAEQAGLSSEATQAALGTLSEKAGDAAAIRMFQKIGELLGNDTIVQGAGGMGFGTTPAEARAQLAKMRAPDGEYAKAVQTNNRAELARLTPLVDRLTKISTGG